MQPEAACTQAQDENQIRHLSQRRRAETNLQQTQTKHPQFPTYPRIVYIVLLCFSNQYSCILFYINIYFPRRSLGQNYKTYLYSTEINTAFTVYQRTLILYFYSTVQRQFQGNSKSDDVHSENQLVVAAIIDFLRLSLSVFVVVVNNFLSFVKNL